MQGKHVQAWLGVVAGAAILGSALSILLRAGHQATPVRSYTGCLEIKTGIFYNFAQGDTPQRACRTGDEQVHLGGGDITQVATPVTGGLQGAAADGIATLSLQPGFSLPQGCAANQIPRWNGTAWICSTESITPLDISARVYHSSNISIPHDTPTALTFDSERWDTDSIHNPGDATKLTAMTAGKYFIFGHVVFAGNATEYRIIQIILNGTTSIASAKVWPTTASVANLSIATHYDLAVGDFLQLVVSQTSGGALLVLSSSGSPTPDASGNQSPEFGMVKLP